MILRLVHLLAPRLKDWGEAMVQEAASIRHRRGLAFALGCSVWIIGCTDMPAIGPDLKLQIDLQTRPRQGRWASRDTALGLCCRVATGLLFLSAAGAPPIPDPEPDGPGSPG
jgi:hypothetical protein